MLCGWKQKQLKVIKSNNFKRVQKLVNNPMVTVNAKDHSNHVEWTPLHYAAQYGHLDVCGMFD